MVRVPSATALRCNNHGEKARGGIGGQAGFRSADAGDLARAELVRGGSSGTLKAGRTFAAEQFSVRRFLEVADGRVAGLERYRDDGARREVLHRLPFDCRSRPGRGEKQKE